MPDIVSSKVTSGIGFIALEEHQNVLAVDQYRILPITRFQDNRPCNLYFEEFANLICVALNRR